MIAMDTIGSPRLQLANAVRDANFATYRLRDVPAVQVALTLLGMTYDCADRCGETAVPAPDRCLNCDAPSLPMFCSERCDQEAALVRYVRRAIADGRLRNAGVCADGIGIRLLMIYAGGYPRRARYIPLAVREAVHHRDQGLCQMCGASGTEIDHILDDRASMTNLRLLCGTCNRGRVNDRAIAISDPDEEQQLLDQTWAIANRVAADAPLRVCDDEQTWQRRWREFRAQRG